MKKLMHKIRGKSGIKIQQQDVTRPPDNYDQNQDTSKHVVDLQDPLQPKVPAPAPAPPPGPGPGLNRRGTVSPVGLQDDVGTFSGFDTWLSSFTPDSQEQNIVEMPVQQVYRDVLVMKGFAPEEYITIILNGVKKPSHAQKFSVEVQGPYFMTLKHVTRLLKDHGYEEPISAKHASLAVPQWNPDRAQPQEYQIFAVDASSCYDADAESGLLINKDESLADFEESIRRLRVRCKEDRVEVVSFPAKLDITFNSTLRLPEDGKVYNQPSGVGHIPVSNIAWISKKLQNSGNASLIEMARKGGVFFPLYQREAMFLSFKATNDNFAIRTFVGGINAISGLPWNSPPSQRPSKQDYVSVPTQKFLDGIAVGQGTVRQFIAMPLGSGYSVEKQVTGKEDVGGMQLEIIPGSQWYVRPKLAQNTTPHETPRSLSEDTVILDWRFQELEDSGILDTSETAEPWVKTHSPVYMRHLYRSQIMRYQSEYLAWQPGSEVYMTAVYKLNLLLSYEQNGSHRTMGVEWAPWWTLEQCIQERSQAGAKIMGTAFNTWSMRLLYQGRPLQPCSLGEQAIEDNSILQVVLLQPSPPGYSQGWDTGGRQWQEAPFPQQTYQSSPFSSQVSPVHPSSGQPGPGMQRPQHSSYPTQSASPVSPQYGQTSPNTPISETYPSPGSSSTPQVYHVGQSPQFEGYSSPSSTSAPSWQYGHQYSPLAVASVAESASASAGSRPVASPGYQLPVAPGSAVPSSPGSARPQAFSQKFPSVLSEAQRRASRMRASNEQIGQKPPCGVPMRLSAEETYDSGHSVVEMAQGSGNHSLVPSPLSAPSSATPYSSPPRSDTATSWSSRPASTQAHPKPTDQTGWAMGIAAGSRIYQKINKDPFKPSAWCKHRTTMISVQILNSVAFESLTGMLAPPSPITPQMYKQKGLPFFESYGEAATTDGQDNLSGVKSVGELDSEGGNIQLNSRLNGSTKVACTCCRKMLCDSILRPCNHIFCSSCVFNYMRYNTAVFCRICNTRVSKLLGFSAPMALPGEDRVDFSDAKVVTMDPFQGAVGFQSIYELDGDMYTQDSEVNHQMYGQNQGTHVQQTVYELST